MHSPAKIENTHELKVQAHCMCLQAKLARHGVTPPESRIDDRGIAASHHGLGQAGESNHSTDAQLRVADTTYTLGSIVFLSIGRPKVPRSAFNKDHPHIVSTKRVCLRRGKPHIRRMRQHRCSICYMYGMHAHKSSSESEALKNM